MKPARFAILSSVIFCLLNSSTFLDSLCIAQEKPSTSVPLLKATKSKDGTTSISVTFNDRLFARFIADRYDKPVFYPIATPNGVNVTRSWPLETDSDGKPIKAGIADDHPHHKSLWFAHEINGLDFWTEKDGTILNDELRIEENRLLVESNWTAKDGTVVCQDDTVYKFGQTEIDQEIKGHAQLSRANWIDAEIKIHASDADIKFKDTKEGFFAIRTHPDLRLTPDPKRGVKQVFGHAVNSAKQTDKALWGQIAKWVMYYGPVQGSPVSILMCDHPSNFRHPTTWHARDYGLVAANPFGLHDFLGKPAGSGAVTIARGQSLTLRYRVYFADGILDVDDAEKLFARFK